MPIELWWWVEPLFNTGFLTIVLAAVIVHLVDKNTSSTVIPAIVAAFNHRVGDDLMERMGDDGK